jgi:hypothetical protein
MAEAALLELAKLRSPEAQAELVLGISEIMFRNVDAASEKELGLFSEIALLLYGTLPDESRAQLSRKLATQKRAPVPLAKKLAKDKLDIAKPMLTHGVCLKQEDLLDLVQQINNKHLEYVAGRRELDTSVTDVLVKRGTKATRRTLAGNRDVRLSRVALQNLVRDSVDDVVLREDLVLRHDLTPRLCEQMLSFVNEKAQQKLRGILDGTVTKDDLSQIAKLKQIRREFGPKLDTSDMRKLWKLTEKAGLDLDELLLLLLEDNRLTHIAELIGLLARKSVADVRNAIYKGGAEFMVEVAMNLNLRPETFSLIAIERCRHLRIPESQANEWIRAYLDAMPPIEESQPRKRQSEFATNRPRKRQTERRRDKSVRMRRLAAI